MPFNPAMPVNAPVALPDEIDLNPQEVETDTGALGAAFRLENPIVSAATSYTVDQSEDFDPEFHVYDAIQGTEYEGYSDRFLDARNAKQVEMMKAQIDRELDDRRAVAAAGGMGMVAEMAAGLLSPTSLLPGGAVVRGAKGGVSIGKTALSVSGSAGAAVAIDELMLQSSQETRTAGESAAAIGGGILLGGLLGGAVGKMSARSYARSSTAAARLPEDIVALNDELRKMQEDERVAGVPADEGIKAERKDRPDNFKRVYVSENADVDGPVVEKTDIGKLIGDLRDDDTYGKLQTFNRLFQAKKWEEFGSPEYRRISALQSIARIPGIADSGELKSLDRRRRGDLNMSSDVPEWAGEFMASIRKDFGMDNEQLNFVTFEHASELENADDIGLGKFRRAQSEPGTLAMMSYSRGKWSIGIRRGLAKTPENMENLAHEIGHLMQFKMFDTLPKRQQADILAEYAKFASKPVDNLSSLRFQRQPYRTTINEARRAGFSSRSELVQNVKDGDASYTLDFSEWFADQVARNLSISDNATSVSSKFFGNVGAVWKRIAEWLKGQGYTNKSVDAFLENARVNARKLDPIEGEIPSDNNGSRLVNRSMGAAENAVDMDMRRQALFDFFDKSQFRVEESLRKYVPETAAKVAAAPLAVLRPLVRSDPILRGMMSTNDFARRMLPELVETPLQYKVNEQGQTVLGGKVSVERAIDTRRNTELAKSLGELNKSFAEYVKDGPVGTVGRLTAPVTNATQHLLKATEKLTRKQFMEEVGRAAMMGDQHPIPQVAQAAQMVRKNIFEKARLDAIEVGIFDPDLQIKFADSYFMRSYNVEKVLQHLGDGSENDMSAALIGEFKKNRQAAITRLENDDTVERAQDQLQMAREELRGIQRAYDTAVKRAKDKRTRAEAAVKREGAVASVTGRLSDRFFGRAAKLREGLLEGEDLAAFKSMIKDVRGVKQLEPDSLFAAIRGFGGIKDPRRNSVWRNNDWANDGRRTEIEDALGDSAKTIRRDDGLEPDLMREALVDAGYLDEDAGVDGLLEAIKQEAGGEKIYSRNDAQDLLHYEATMDLADELEKAGVDVSKPMTQIIQSLEGKARSQKVTKAKAGEAERSGKKAAKAGGDGSGIQKAMDRVQEAQERLDYLKEVQPKVKEELKAARQKVAENLKSVQDAKKARGADEFYANKDDLEIEADVDSAIRSLTGMKVGEHSIGASLSSPTKARVLDVADEVLAPWLEKDMGIVMAQYFNSIVPDIEMARAFGPDGFGIKLNEIMEEGQRLAKNAKTVTEKKRHVREAEERAREMRQMADRLTGRFGVPDNPKEGWVRASRIARTASYMGFLGGMTISAIPDVAGVIGRNGIEAAFGSMTALTDRKRMGMAIKDAQEMGSAAEWYLNARAIAIADIADQYGSNSKFERAMGQGANVFGVATGMIPWNAGWKMVGATFVSSKMSKAAMRTLKGQATKKDKLTLSANGIEPWMADRIAKQLEKHGDMDGDLWLPQGRLWDDDEAYAAFQNAMNRELNLMIVTPGQDKPFAFSTPAGSFFLQFKSFMMSAHHRVLLAGLQRADAEVLAQVTTAMALGGLVSNVKSWQSGNDPKEGVAYWEDALDRSGLAGWLMEPYSALGAITNGATSVSGEEVSRYQSRSMAEGLLGPSVDMGVGVFEGVTAIGRGKVTDNDARMLARPLPGNNLPYVLDLYEEVTKAGARVFGAETD